MIRPSVVLAEATRRLAAAGVPSARVDAELLLAGLVGVARGRLPAVDLTEDQVAPYTRMIDRRAAREPLQYILGRAPFGPLELRVGPGVFIPRPETELLASWAAEHAAPGSAIVDLCAGSGAIGLYLAAVLPDVRVALVERDRAALVYLRENAVGSGAAVIAADVADPDIAAQVEAAVGGAVSLVVSNPPYVPRNTHLDVEAAADPVDAVFSGDDGLDLIRVIAPLAGRLLRNGGAAAIEHDDSNGAGTAAMLRTAGFDEVAEHRDLNNRPRYVTGRMSA